MIRVFFRRCGETYREQHAAAYALLYAAAAFCGYETDPGRLERTAMGKPFFRDCPGLYFSLSHAGGYAICALGEIPCGVDLERRRTIPLRVCKRYLGGAEGEEALRRWTMRESFGKLDGGGFFTDAPLPPDAAFGFREREDYLLTVCAHGFDGRAEVYLEENGVFTPDGFTEPRIPD